MSPAFGFRAAHATATPDNFSSRLSFVFLQVCLPHFQDKVFLEKALERYENFISLVKENRDFLWVAPYDIELLWRAHLLQPVTYSKVYLYDIELLWRAHLLQPVTYSKVYLYDIELLWRAHLLQPVTYSKVKIVQALTKIVISTCIVSFFVFLYWGGAYCPVCCFTATFCTISVYGAHCAVFVLFQDMLHTVLF